MTAPLRSRATTAAGLLLTTTMLFGVAACGGDDGDAAGATDSSLCSGITALDQLEGPGGGPTDPTAEDLKAFGAQIKPIVADIKGGLDGKAAADITVIEGAVTQFEAGDGAPLDDPATDAALINIRKVAVSECAFGEQAVTAADYRFTLPGTLPAGPFVATMANEGKEPHVLLMLRKDGTELSNEEVVKEFTGTFEGGAMPEGVVPVPSGLFAPPGATNSRVYDLEPGTYVYFCPIPSGADGRGPAHDTLGMLGEVKVS